eukprot:gene4599-5632_t
MSAEQDPGPDRKLTNDQIRLLYMVQMYTEDDAGKGREDNWIRELPLLVLVFEGISTKCFTYDYAPKVERIRGKRVYFNITQEGRHDIDILRSLGLLNALKVTSKNYHSSLSLRISPLGSHYLNHYLDHQSKIEIEKLVMCPDGNDPNSNNGLLLVQWDNDTAQFALHDAHSLMLRWSGITDIEDVSYVSSPFVPQHLRVFGDPTSANSDRVDELSEAKFTIHSDLNERFVLNDVLLLLCEWVPMGGNQIVALNDKLGSSERVQGGFFTATLDENPDYTQFQGDTGGLTSVTLLDYDETMYVNFEAEVFYPTGDPGNIVQIENFGVHINESGLVSYGLQLDAIEDRIKERLSLDLLSRLLIDVQKDTSKLLHNLLSSHQRAMLELTYLNESITRDKFIVLLASDILPRHPSFETYIADGDNVNEIKQVIGDVRSGHDLTAQEMLFVGGMGTLCVGESVERHLPFLCTFGALQTRNMFMKSVYNCCHILADFLKMTRDMIDTFENNPNSVSLIRERLSIANEEAIMLSEIQEIILESCDAVEYPEVLQDDEGSKNVAAALQLEDLGATLKRRALDFEKTIEGCTNELEALREMANVISEAESLRCQESLQSNTKNLEDSFRAGARQGTSLEMMNVIFAGTLAFDIVDRFTGQYMSIADRIEWLKGGLQAYLVEVPGAWFAVNMGAWTLLGGFLIFFMRFLTYMSTSVESKRARVNLPVDLPTFHKWLSTKRVISQDVEELESETTMCTRSEFWKNWLGRIETHYPSLSGTLDLNPQRPTQSVEGEDARSAIKTYMWAELDPKAWGGLPPRFELTVDERYHFILQVNKRRCKCTAGEAYLRIYEEMEESDVMATLDQDNVWTEATRFSRKLAKEPSILTRPGGAT